MKSVFAPKKISAFLGILFCLFPLLTQGQTINAPIIEFGDICASSNFNSYTVSFDFVGFPGGTTFGLEMSDKTGDFSKPTPISVLSSQIVGGNMKITFAVPVTVSGKLYSVRAKTTNYNPQVFSSPSIDFNAYYWLFNNRIKILDNGSGALSICGNSGKLSIDATAPSPLQFKSLSYVWKKNGVIIPNETKEELTVTTPGTYRVEVDYGNCNNVIGFLAYSQDVNVSFSNTTNAYSITSSLGTTNICPSNPTTLSTSAGQTYQWYLNGSAINGATSYKLVTFVSGTYKVIVSPGTPCQSSSNEISITSKDFDSTINSNAISDSYSIAEGTSLDLVAEAQNAVNPSFAWFEPNNAIAISNTNTISLINKPKESKPLKTGLYTLKVTNNDPTCSYTKTYKFNIKSGVESIAVPNIISPNDQNGENDFWILPKEYKGADIEVIILDAYGKEVFKTFNYQDNWPKEPIEFKTVNPIFYYIISKDGSPLKKGSLTVLK